MSDRPEDKPESDSDMLDRMMGAETGELPEHVMRYESTAGNGPGAPRKFKAIFIKQACILAEAGLTEVEIARAFDVSFMTMQVWKRNFPELKEQLVKGKELFDSRIEHSIAQAAIGYEHPAVQIFLSKEGEVVEVPYIKRYPPSVAAAELWLRNRRERSNGRLEAGDIQNQRTLSEKLDEMNKKLEHIKVETPNAIPKDPEEILKVAQAEIKKDGAA